MVRFRHLPPEAATKRIGAIGPVWTPELYLLDDIRRAIDRTSDSSVYYPDPGPHPWSPLAFAAAEQQRQVDEFNEGYKARFRERQAAREAELKGGGS